MNPPNPFSRSRRIPPHPTSPRHRHISLHMPTTDRSHTLLLTLIALFTILIPLQAQKPKTITINGTTFLADPALLSEKPKSAPQKKSPPKSQATLGPTPRLPSRPTGKNTTSKPAPTPKPDWPPPHTGGSVRHPDYDPALNSKGCPATLKSEPNQKTFGMGDAFDIKRQLSRTHPHWIASQRISRSSSTGLARMPDNTPVWVAKVNDQSKNSILGELHILATDHPRFGRAGTVLLDTVPDSPLLEIPAQPASTSTPPTASRPFSDTHRPWGPEQATGEPDTLHAGDIPTAWAARFTDHGPEWLEVSFPNPVEISEIRIRETLHPGAITKVLAHIDEEKIHTLWEGIASPTTAPNEMSVVPKEKITSNRLTLHLDTRLVPGWNQIDSVELLGTDGSRQWASQARASSTYAEILIRPQALPTGTENIPSCNESFEREVFTLVNTERHKRNLPALVWNENLARAARYHAADMASNGYFHHDSMIRRTDSPGSPLRKIATCRERLQLFDPSGGGENIAVGQPTPASVMKSWMNSSGHRANILRKNSKSLGIGFVAGHWVQNFGR
jgi:uncharacterized protein YkwD